MHMKLYGNKYYIRMKDDMTSQGRDKITRQPKCYTAGSGTAKEESWAKYYLDFIRKEYVLRSQLGVLFSFYL